MTAPNNQPHFPTMTHPPEPRLPHERLVPGIPVKHTVTYFNPNFSKTFRIKQGEQSPLGLFVDPPELRPELHEGKILTPTHFLAVSNNHNRSSLFTRAYFKDSFGNLYRDIELKGTGLVPRIDLSHGAGLRELGFQDIGHADEENANANLLNFLGIPAISHIAHLKVNEVVIGGRKMTVKQAKKEKLLRPDWTPAILARAFGVRYRVVDLRDFPSRKMVDDAKTFAQKEAGVEKMSDLQYAKWFAQKLGTSLGRMTHFGLTHFSMDSHQICLDARLADLAGLKYMGNEIDHDKFDKIRGSGERVTNKLFETQRKKAELCLEDFNRSINKVSPTIDEDEIRAIFNKSYFQAAATLPEHLRGLRL